MSGRPTKLSPAQIDAWLSGHAGWERSGEGIAKKFGFHDFATALAFVVRVGCYAESRDHHPEATLTWGSARLLWSTHDAGGVTQLDVDAAEACDAMKP
jgi:4a-hydroxytetrahydrobiopterin dehydratase